MFMSKSRHSPSSVNEDPLWRWMQVPEFRATFAAASRQVLESLVAELFADAQAAFYTLRRNLNCVRAEV